MHIPLTLLNSAEVNSNFAKHFSGIRYSDKTDLWKEGGSPSHVSKYTTLTQAQKAKKEKMCLIIAELLQNRKQKTPYSFLCISFLDRECLFFEEICQNPSHANYSYVWTGSIIC